MTGAAALLLCYASLIPVLPPPVPPPGNETAPGRWRFPPSRFHDAIAFLTPRDEPLVARDAQDRVVRTGPARRGVDEDVHVLVDDQGGRRLREHDVQVCRPEHRLGRVERQPGELGLDQVGAVLHHRLEQLVPVARLPPGDEVQPVHALRGLPLLDARVAGQLDLVDVEQGRARRLVAHLDEA